MALPTICSLLPALPQGVEKKQQIDRRSVSNVHTKAERVMRLSDPEVGTEGMEGQGTHKQSPIIPKTRTIASNDGTCSMSVRLR